MGRVSTGLFALVSSPSAGSLEPCDFALGISIIVQRHFPFYFSLLLIMQIVELLLGLQEGTLSLT